MTQHRRNLIARIRAPAVGLALLASPGAALADPAYDACTGRADAVMPELGDCGSAWIEREDARLNRAWDRLMDAIDGTEPSVKASLLKEQRAWLAFRDTACLVYADEMQFGQNGRYLSFPICRAELIAARTQALDAYRESVEPQ